MYGIIVVKVRVLLANESHSYVFGRMRNRFKRKRESFNIILLPRTKLERIYNDGRITTTIIIILLIRKECVVVCVCAELEMAPNFGIYLLIS